MCIDVFFDLRLNKRLTIGLPVIWDAIAFIMTLLYWAANPWSEFLLWNFIFLQAKEVLKKKKTVIVM